MSKKRKRVTRDQVRENAKKGAGGSSWFSLPDGVDSWYPEKSATYAVDILPYEVASEDHPDDVPQGYLWYKLPFMVHHAVGVKDDSLVCPVSIGKRCPICEEGERLNQEDSDKYEDVIKSLRPQKFVAYNMLDPEDNSKIVVFSFSRGKFASSLENELKLPENEDHLAFFDITKEGRTLKVRWTDASFEGRKYLEATRIDFKTREPMEEEILDKVVCLETAIVVHPYDKLKQLFFQTSEDEEEGSGLVPEKEAPAEEAPAEEPEEEAAAEVEAEQVEAEEAKKAADTMKCALCEDEFDTEDAIHSDRLDKDFCSKKCLKKAEKAAPEEKGDVCKACGGSKKDSKGNPCPICASKKVEPEAEKKPAEECPVDKGKFGKDLDKYQECDDCPVWTDCEAANEG